MVDVKKEIHDAYGIHKMQHGSGGGDPESGRIYGMAKNIWAGKVMAAVEDQPRPLGDLLLMCYAPEWETRNFEVIRTCLWGEFVRQQGDEIKQDRTFLKARLLSEVAVFDYQAQARKGPFTVEMVCDMAGIDRSHWYKPERRWRNWYAAMGRVLHRWEREALRQPRALCNEVAALRQKDRAKMAAS